MTATYETLCGLDARLVRAGVHGMSPFWRANLKRFYEHPTARTLVARVGRGGAKSFTSAKVALNEVLFSDVDVPPGEVHYFAFVSRLKEEAAQRKRLLEDWLRKLGVPFDSEGDQITLRDRRIGIRVLASNIAAASGFRAVGFCADELAKWGAEDDRSSPAGEVVASLNAMTITHSATVRKLLISSPFGMVDYHYERYELGDTDEQIVCQAASWIANPGISQAQTMASEPDLRIWTREYLAVPSATESGAFDAADAMAAFETELEPAGEKIIVTDPSDLRGDTWAWAVVSQTTKGGLAVLAIDGESGRVGVDTVVDRMAALAKEQGVRRIFGDQRNAPYLESAFPKHGLSYKAYPWSLASKDAAVYKLRQLMRERALALPKDDRLRRELLTLKARCGSNGQISYQSNGVDYASCVITLGHVIAANDLSCSACSGNSLYDALRAMCDRGESVLGGESNAAMVARLSPGMNSAPESTWLPWKR
ncbi:MAG: hypothetical protein ABUL62_04455 [Myxococcales bacterium]